MPGPVKMRGWMKGPIDSAPSIPLVYCIAGGGCSTGYFDLQVPGEPNYSMADYLVEAGFIVTALDHPGVGAADPVADTYELTPTRLAASHDLAWRELHARLTKERGLDPRTVGLGHSMGGLIAAVAQGRHRTFDALVCLGASGVGLPEVLTEEELAVTGPSLEAIEPRIVALARERFRPHSTIPRRQPARGTFFAADVPASVRKAFADQAVPLLFTSGLTSMIPRSVAAERATVEVPTFLAYGDDDLTSDFEQSVADFRGAPSVDLFVLAASGHCHNQASSRQVLWARIVDWINSLGPVSS